MDVLSNTRISTDGLPPGAVGPHVESGLDEKNEAIHAWMKGVFAEGGLPSGLSQGQHVPLGGEYTAGDNPGGDHASFFKQGLELGHGPVQMPHLERDQASSSGQSSVDTTPSELKDGLMNPAYIRYQASLSTAKTPSTSPSSVTSDSTDNAEPQEFKNGLLNPDFVTYQEKQTASANAASVPTSDGTTATGDDSDDTQNKMPSRSDTRPPGDTRTADQIVNDNPTMKNLGNQENILTNLKKNCGDWTDPSLSTAQRADAAYRASQVINYIKGSSASDGTARSSDVTDDGRIDGFTSSGQARHGTEAGMLKDFGEQGYGALPADQRLPVTTDKYVNKDGTTKSNAQVIGEEIGKALLSVLKVVMNVISQVLSVVADLKIPGLSQLAALASVGAEAVSGAANIGVTALNGGDTKKAAEQMGIDVAEQAVSSLTAPGLGKALGKGVEAGVEAGENVAQRAAKSGGEQIAGDVYSQYAPQQKPAV